MKRKNIQMIYGRVKRAITNWRASKRTFNQKICLFLKRMSSFVKFKYLICFFLPRNEMLEARLAELEAMKNVLKRRLQAVGGNLTPLETSFDSRNVTKSSLFSLSESSYSGYIFALPFVGKRNILNRRCFYLVRATMLKNFWKQHDDVVCGCRRRHREQLIRLNYIKSIINLRPSIRVSIWTRRNLSAITDRSAERLVVKVRRPVRRTTIIRRRRIIIERKVRANRIYPFRR